MIKSTVFILALLLALSSSAQDILTLNLDTCYVLAKNNYPLLRHYGMIEKAKDYSIANASKGYLPQFIIAGQVTNQSEVTKVPISLPNASIPEISRDQYKIYGEITQPITDLFTVKYQVRLIEASALIDEEQNEAELYKLKDRINNLYFGILLIDEQIKQNALLRDDIQSGLDKINIGIENGTAIKSSADNLSAELLKVGQHSIELKSNRSAYAVMLSQFINRNISANTIFTKPLPVNISNAIKRAELNLYELQKKSFDTQSKLISAKNLPRFSLFLQGGFGRPALNMLSNDLRGYYIGGLRVNWNITGFYTANKEKRILELNQSTIDVQKDVFLFNTKLGLLQQNEEVSKVQELIQADNDIIALRDRIKSTVKYQLENGTATSNEYLLAVNAHDLSRQNLIIHKIQLLLAQYTLQYTSGN